MSESRPAGTSRRVYRVDKFIVPTEAREEFLGNVRNTHELLRTQRGFIQDFVLEKSGGPGDFNFVTFVEWESDEAVENARAAVRAMQARTGFSPRELMSRLGITADIADYRQVDS